MSRTALLLGFLGLAACGTPFYEPCDESGRCPSDYVCADRETIPVCTTFCSTTDECRSRHGDRTICTRSGVCLATCSRDDDCPPSAYCDLGTSTCLR